MNLILVIVASILFLTSGQFAERDKKNPEAAVSELTKGAAGGAERRRRPRLSPRVPRSISHTEHPDGINRTCSHDALLKSFLPKSYRVVDNGEGKHYHLLLAVNDNQLAMLINWLAVAFSLGYLPSHRVLIHFSCHGPLTHTFVEKHLLSECQKAPVRKYGQNETSWRHVIKDRLGNFLEIVEALDESDAGAISFDIDAPWIRNMIAVFDYFAKPEDQDGGGAFDFIAQGNLMDEMYGGRIITNFGGVLIRNTKAGKALAKNTLKALNSDYEADWPDQDYVTKALFVDGNATQVANQKLKSIAGNSEFSNEHCHKYRKTCAWLEIGAQGTFTFSPGDVKGAYMFLPQLVAPHKCEHICSGSTVLFQHCGLSNCLKGEPVESNCDSIPEFILSTHNVHKLVSQIPPPHGFKAAPHGTFDSRALEHMLKSVRKFIDPSRVIAFCDVYPAVCRPNKLGDGIVLVEK